MALPENIMLKYISLTKPYWGWSGGAKVLGKLSVRGVLLVWMIVGQGPIALAEGAGGDVFGHFFSHLCFLFSFSLSLRDGPI